MIDGKKCFICKTDLEKKAINMVETETKIMIFCDSCCQLIKEEIIKSGEVIIRLIPRG